MGRTCGWRDISASASPSTSVCAVLKTIETAKIRYPKRGDDFDRMLRNITKEFLPLSVRAWKGRFWGAAGAVDSTCALTLPASNRMGVAERLDRPGQVLRGAPQGPHQPLYPAPGLLQEVCAGDRGGEGEGGEWTRENWRPSSCSPGQSTTKRGSAPLVPGAGGGALSVGMGRGRRNACLAHWLTCCLSPNKLPL